MKTCGPDFLKISKLILFMEDSDIIIACCDSSTLYLKNNFAMKSSLKLKLS